MGMKYTGKGNFRVGVPARNLTDAEVKKFGREYLLSTGFYEEIRKPKKRKEKIDIPLVDEPEEEEQ